MTCIVGYKIGAHVWIGGDRAVSYGDSIYTAYTPKVWSQKGLIIGMTGTYREEQIVQEIEFISPLDYKYSNFDPRTQIIPPLIRAFANKEMSASLIIGVPNRVPGLTALIEIEPDFGVINIPSFTAIGSGAVPAIAALKALGPWAGDDLELSPKEMIKGALTISAEMTPSVRPPFDILEL